MNIELIRNSVEYRKAKQFVETVDNAQGLVTFQLTVEEFEGFLDAVEQLDELSKGTLSSYITKAYKDRGDNAKIATKLGSMKHADKAAKRNVGIHTAMKKAS